MAERLFICWSGELSREIARHLERWLGRVLPELEVFSSPRTPKGSDWREVLRKKLSASDAGILCITQENRENLWIHLEAGAIGVRSAWKGVFSFLFDVDPSELSPTLEMFQCTKFERADVKKMLTDLCDLAGIPQPEAERRFDDKWPGLYINLNKLRSGGGSQQQYTGPAPFNRAQVRKQQKRALARRALLAAFLESGKELPGNWTKDETFELYSALKEAEADNDAWPLQRGEGVRQQRPERDELNGLDGRVVEPWTTPHCYSVKFTKRDGSTQEEKRHALYLTRLQFLEER